jgi:hypothetical protein
VSKEGVCSFGADLPQDVRAIAKIDGSRKMRDVVRHKCSNCDFDWLGPVSLMDYNLIELCLECGSPRYHKTSTRIKPVSKIWYFGVDHAISRMHCLTSFRVANKSNPA